jgi:hypothetical protein
MNLSLSTQQNLIKLTNIYASFGSTVLAGFPAHSRGRQLGVGLHSRLEGPDPEKPGPVSASSDQGEKTGISHQEEKTGLTSAVSSWSSPRYVAATTSSKPAASGSNSSRSSKPVPHPSLASSSHPSRRWRSASPTNGSSNMTYECIITDDPSLASAVFIPFYASLDMTRHFSLASTSARWQRMRLTLSGLVRSLSLSRSIESHHLLRLGLQEIPTFLFRSVGAAQDLHHPVLQECQEPRQRYDITTRESPCDLFPRSNQCCKLCFLMKVIMFLRNLFTFMPMTLFTFLIRHLVQLNTVKGREGNLYKHQKETCINILTS